MKTILLNYADDQSYNLVERGDEGNGQNEDNAVVRHRQKFKYVDGSKDWLICIYNFW